MKKFISLVLVLIMITSLVPPFVLALDDPEEIGTETGIVVDTAGTDTSAETEISIENEGGEQAGEPVIESEVEDNSVIEQEGEIPAVTEDDSDKQEHETEPTETPSTEQMTLVNTDGSISVSGVLPSGAVLSAERIENPFAAPTRKMMSAAKSRSAEVATDDITKWNYIAFFDIKLVDDNVSVQPDGTATVTISGLSLADGSNIKVLHILDSVDAIRNGTGFAVSDPGFVSKFPAEVAAAY